MTRGILTFSTFASVVLFPWPLAVLLTLSVSFLEPLVPLAAGIFADVLYYAPQAHFAPVFTIYGAFVTGLIYLVRSRLSTGIIEK